MSDINCPYCNAAQEINHDDGYGYEEDEKHEQHCSGCDKAFKFTTSIMYCYSAYCSDEDDHDMDRPLPEMSPEYFHCTKCEHSEIRHIDT